MNRVFNHTVQHEDRKLSIEIGSDQDHSQIQIRLTRGDYSGSLKLTLDQSNDIVDIKDFLKLSATSSCLALCGIAIVGPILDCWRNNKGNWSGFLSCLKDQKYTLGSATIACLAACS